MRLYRVLFMIVALAAVALLLRGRCSQLERARDEALTQGLIALREALGEPPGDLEAARRAFTGAARHAVGDVYGVFCLSAVDELDGRGALEAPAVDGWDEAVGSLRAGRLESARAAFEALAQLAGRHVERARLYLRLIDDLERL